MALSYGKRPYTVDDLANLSNLGPTGWYTFKLNDRTVPLYVDQDYDGGGWVMVMANRRYTAGMNNLKFADAVGNVNYRTNGTDDATNDKGGVNSTTTLDEINAWVGLDFWPLLGGRETSGKITVVQFTGSSNGESLSNSGSTQTERARWNFDRFMPGSNYRFYNAGNISLELGSQAPGFYASHATTTVGLSTFDDDNDTHPGNCSTFYNNNPWWYTSCWNGNYFAGGGHIDGPYWYSSTSSWSRQYGAVYIK